MNIRTGLGIDFHRLEEGRNLWIGGVNIPSRRGCIAHSDGDVLLHAICDALLGAAGLRDIGFQFPDNDPAYKDIDSKILLGRTIKLIREKGYSVVNIDSTICLESPKISAFVPGMKAVISEIAGTGPDDVGIKATTTEKMGFTGREEGVVALASVLITRQF